MKFPSAPIPGPGTPLDPERVREQNQNHALPFYATRPFLGEGIPLPDIPTDLHDSDRAARTKRLSHTLKRIKDKGYYTNNATRLTAISGRLSATTPNIFDSLRQSIDFFADAIDWEDVEISDTVWHLAIDSVMSIYHPEIHADPFAMYAPLIDSEIDKILTWALFLAYIRAQDFELACLLCEIEDDSPFDEADYEEDEEDEEEDEEGVSISALLENTQALEAARQRIAELEHALAREKRARQKEVMKLEHRLDAIQKESQGKILSLKEQNTQLMEFILHMDTPKTQDAEEEDEGTPPPPQGPEKKEYALPLPESRVLFLGGHPNLLKKVEAKHPDWQFLNDDNFRSRPVGSSVDVIFFWSAHSSHSLRNKVFPDLTNLPPVVYVAATNIDRLEQEMLAGYNTLNGKEA